MAEPHVTLQPRGRGLPIGAMLSALALGACQAIPTPKGPAAPPPPPPPPTQQNSGGLPEDQARDRVALLVPTTGPNSGVGQAIANAATLALLDTGGKGVRVTTYDTGAGATVAAQRALAEGNKLILGPLLADEVRAVAPAARGAGVPVIAFSNDAGVAGDGVFVMGFAPAQSVERVVSYARSQNLTKFAGLMPAGLYGQNASNTLLRAAESAGASVTAMQTYQRNPAALADAVKKLGSDYQAVLIADGSRIAIQAAPQIRRAGASGVKILGTELWNAEGPAIANPALTGAWFASVPDTMFRALSGKYRARFGKPPSRLASLGYDAVLLTVRIAADWQPGRPFPVARLTDPGGFGGVDGAFRFRRDGVAERALEVRQVGTGGTIVVSPAPTGF